jgi:hypothetical protein
MVTEFTLLLLHNENVNWFFVITAWGTRQAREGREGWWKGMEIRRVPRRTEAVALVLQALKPQHLCNLWTRNSACNSDKRRVSEGPATQFPILSITEGKEAGRGLKLTTHLNLVARLRMRRIYRSPIHLPGACLIKHRDNFTFSAIRISSPLNSMSACLFWSPKVHCGVYKRLKLVCNLSRFNEVPDISTSFI